MANRRELWIIAAFDIVLRYKIGRIFRFAVEKLGETAVEVEVEVEILTKRKKRATSINEF